MNDRQKMQRGEVVAVGRQNLLAELLGPAELAGAVSRKSEAQRLWHSERGVIHSQSTGVVSRRAASYPAGREGQN